MGPPCSLQPRSLRLGPTDGALASAEESSLEVVENTSVYWGRRISYPNEELPVARNVKVSPMHQQTSAEGAVYGTRHARHATFDGLCWLSGV